MSEVRKRRTLKRIKIEKRRGSKAIESGLILIAQFQPSAQRRGDPVTPRSHDPQPHGQRPGLRQLISMKNILSKLGVGDEFSYSAARKSKKVL
jgi:hypothetical protein